MERGIKGTLLDLELLLGGLLDPACHGEAVHRPAREGFENEEIEGPADEVEVGVGHLG
jgi:hypothetical protein